MIKIIIYSMDGLGIGHIMRGINIAKELRKIIDCKIIFVTNAPFLDIFEKERFGYQSGGVDPYELNNGNISQDEYRRINEEFLLSVIKNDMPQIIIFDLLVMPNVIEYAKKKNIFLVYLLGELHSWHYLLPFKNYLCYFDLVLLACVFDTDFISKFKNIGFAKNKIFVVGNIFREPDKNKIDIIKQKYKKKNNELLITISAGGGGFIEWTKDYYSILGIVAKKIKSGLKGKKGTFINVRWLLIKGFLFKEEINVPKNIEVHDYEIDLPELFSISDLVVSAGGYNSINEIIASKTPALVCPRMVTQLGRASAYASKGFIQLFNIFNPKESIDIFKKVINSSNINKMKKSYDNYVHKNGKRLSAGIILREYLKYS